MMSPRRKSAVRVTGLVCVAVMVWGLMMPRTGLSAGNQTTVYPPPSSDILINPGKGWLIYAPFSKLDTLPADALASAAGCYTRYEWAQLEPAEDAYTWSMIDNDIATCAAKGLTFGFGIMAANSCTNQPEVTPDWVFAAGADATSYTNDCLDGSITLKAPVWHDPVFKNKLQDLIDALKTRYDGHPDIAFIDNRNCGNWGEWHSLGCSDLSDSDRMALLDMFAGWTTPVIIPNNLNSAEYQVAYGVDTYQHGCRRDSANYHPDGCAYAYDKSLAVSEWETSYARLKQCGGWSGQCWSDDLVANSMVRSRYSYDNMGQWGDDTALFYNENPALVHEWANRMGYWFRITEITYTDNLGNGSSGVMSFTVRNDGVAPIYVNKQAGGQTYVKLALLDHDNKVLTTTTLGGIDPFDWKPFDATNTTYQESAVFSFAHDAAGDKLALGLFTDPSLVTPDIQLGITGRLPSGWYPVYLWQYPVYLPMILRH